MVSKSWRAEGIDVQTAKRLVSSSRPCRTWWCETIQSGGGRWRTRLITVEWNDSSILALALCKRDPSGRLATIVELCHGLLQWSRGDIDCVRKFW